MKFRLNRLPIKILSGCLATVLLVVAVAPTALAESSAVGDTWKTLLATKHTEDSYHNSLTAYPDAPLQTDGPIISGDAVLPESQNVQLISAGDKTGVTLGVEGVAVFKVTIEKTGFYQMKIRYRYENDESFDNSDLAIAIDGKAPFYQAQRLALPRIWTQEPLEHKENENDITPKPLSIMEIADYVPLDESGVDGNYQFYFTAGEHQVSFRSKAGGFSLWEIFIGVPNDVSWPLYEFTTVCLGVRPIDGGKAIRIAPQARWIDAVSGRVMTPCGTVSVSVKCQNETWQVDAVCPAVPVEVVLPNGSRYVFEQGGNISTTDKFELR